MYTVSDVHIPIPRRVHAVHITDVEHTKFQKNILLTVIN